ncbi:MAG: SH3 domain-containing protein [Bacteroidetes bacterium]|nr:SH3 domain-containing protein [Bacteroidota bacterium]
MTRFFILYISLFLLLACNQSDSSSNTTTGNSLTHSDKTPKENISWAGFPNLTEVSVSIQKHQQVFFEKYLLPWSINKNQLPQFLDHQWIPGKDSTYATNNFLGQKNDWYGENKQLYPENIKQRIAQNADFSGFPNFFHKGITVNHTDLRRLPTEKPGYGTYSQAGEGFPFDYFQETSVWANTPVLLLQLSLDRQWAYVITSFYKGWVPFKDLAIVDEPFINQWKGGEFAFVVKDHFPIHSSDGISGLNGRIGMVLPVKSSAQNQVTVYLPVIGNDHKAILKEADIDQGNIRTGFSQMNETLIKSMAQDMVGQAYGWGGFMGNRDCSSTIRDFLTPFGIWLPRNSTDQAIYGDVVAGKNYDLSQFHSREEKIQFIKEKGIPFLTILWMRGHAMLYIGNDSTGMPLILHSKWALKTVYPETEALNLITANYPVEGIHKTTSADEKTGKEITQFVGRRLIGKTVITSVNFDQVYDDLKSYIIDDIIKMAVLVAEN